MALDSFDRRRPFGDPRERCIVFNIAVVQSHCFREMAEFSAKLGSVRQQATIRFGLQNVPKRVNAMVRRVSRPFARKYVS